MAGMVSTVSERAGAPISTVYDVSRLASVSTATVSRVFSGSAKVSDNVRQRVLEAAKQLAYEPSHAARALVGRRTNTLGAVFPEMASGFYAEVLAGIDEVAAESGFDVLAAFVGTHRRRPELVRRLLRQGRCDAILLLNLDDRLDLNSEAVDQLPIVLIDREIPGCNLPAVGLDNVGGAQAMIEHMFEQGHRRIAILTGPSGNFDSEQRILGCRQGFARLGLTLDERLVWKGAFTVESGGQAARAFLESQQPLPDAIFCLNDAMAIGMLNEFKRAAILVPGDVALGGYDNVEAAEHLSLTTVACPMRLLGQVAARWAVDLVTRNERPAGHRLQVRLVARNSTMGRQKSRRPSEAAASAASPSAKGLR
jgi:LacI family transcriptional regulator